MPEIPITIGTDPRAAEAAAVAAPRVDTRGQSKSRKPPIHRFYDRVLPVFRRKRMARFLTRFPIGPETAILDMGGGLMNWKLIGCESRVTILNIKLPSERHGAPANYRFVQGDATALDFPDGSFDLIFSNSVIEHVGGLESQRRFAAEASRLSRKLWIQTPARGFFLEPHLIAPFIHWLPRAWQVRLVRNFSLWGLLTRPDRAQAEAAVRSVRLMTYAEMRMLFPDCVILRERFLFMTKSYIAVRS